MFRKLTALLILVAALAAILLVAPASAQEEAEPTKGDSDDATVRQSLPAPGNFGPVNRGCTTIRLSWDPVFQATQYGVTYGGRTRTTSNTSYTAIGLSKDTSHSFSVRARSSNLGSGWGSASSTSASTTCLKLGSVSNMTGTVGLGFNRVLSTGNGGMGSLSYSVSGQPPGLSLSDTTLTGTPSTAGTYSVTYKVTDSGSPSQSVSRTFTVRIAPAPLVLGAVSAKSGTADESFSEFLSTATGGTGTLRYSISGQPPGLSLSDTTLTGTPTTAGTYSATYRVRDSGSPQQTDSTTFTVRIAPAPLVLGAVSAKSGTADESFSEFLSTATGGTGTLRYSISGQPPGLSLSVTDGTVNRAKRMTQGSNIGWTITVTPDSAAAVTVVLPVTTDCDADGAVCTAAGRKLSNRLEFTVSGPGQ